LEIRLYFAILAQNNQLGRPFHLHPAANLFWGHFSLATLLAPVSPGQLWTAVVVTTVSVAMAAAAMADTALWARAVAAVA